MLSLDLLHHTISSRRRMEFLRLFAGVVLATSPSPGCDGRFPPVIPGFPAERIHVDSSTSSGGGSDDERRSALL